MLVQFPSTLRADITLPTSKSISARALILRALAGADTPIHDLSDSDDTRALLAALAAATKGNQVERNRQTPQSEEKVVENNGAKTSSDANDSSTFPIDIGAAGTAMRFLTAYFATCAGKSCMLTGSVRMKERPIALLVDALRSLGAEIDYVEKEGFPPVAHSREDAPRRHRGTLCASQFAVHFCAAHDRAHTRTRSYPPSTRRNCVGPLRCHDLGVDEILWRRRKMGR